MFDESVKSLNYNGSGRNAKDGIMPEKNLRDHLVYPHHYIDEDLRLRLDQLFIITKLAIIGGGNLTDF